MIIDLLHFLLSSSIAQLIYVTYQHLSLHLGSNKSTIQAPLLHVIARTISPG